MAVPNIQPPPNWQPIGWSPNSFNGQASIFLGQFNVARIKLITAQLDTLNAAPVTIVPAPGANKVVMPVSFMAITTRTGPWSVSPTYRLQYNGSVTALTSSNPASLLASAGAGTVTASAPVGAIGIASAFTNTPLEVQFSADTNPGANTAEAWLTVAFYILDVTP